MSTMRTLHHFNKNAGVLAALLFCLFFNPGVGKAQWVFTSPTGQEIRVTSDKGGVCGQTQKGIRLNFAYPFTYPTESEIIQYCNSIPKENYFRASNNEQIKLSFEVRNYTGNQSITGIVSHIKMGTETANTAYDTYNPPIVDPSMYQLDDTTSGPGWSGKKGSYLVKFMRKDLLGWAVVAMSDWANLNTSANHLLILPFVIDGIIQDEVPVLGTTLNPQVPYLVLHAPPGDGSSSEFQSTKTTCREYQETFALDNSGSINAAVKIGFAGSVGIFLTTDFEYSVTLSASATAGSLAIKTNSNQTCVTVGEGFSTAAITGPDGGGDVFIGYGPEMQYGVYKQIVIDQNTCVAGYDTGLVYAPTGVYRDFVYTKSGILTDMANQQAIVDNPANTARTRNEAQNQIDVWNQVLAMNDANINNPNNATLNSISFSGNTTSYQESSITVTDMNSIQTEHYIEETAGLEAVMEVAGSGFAGGFEYKGSQRFGQTQNQTQEDSKLIKYTLTDDDGGDLFNLDVVRDPMYGTPVFRIKPGTKSSCPYQGGYQRDQPKLKHDGTTDDHITSQGNPVGSSATFKVDLCNESNETRTYNLKLNAQSNLNGAVVSAAGVPLNGNDLGQSFTVPANSCVQDLIIEVKQLSANSPLSYPDLELFLYAPCEEDIQSSIFVSVYFGNATGLNDLSDNNLLSVSPNPTSGWLQISLPEGNTLEAVRVMDLSGKTVRNLEPGAAASKTELDLSGLPKGIYALQARAEGQMFVKKVVVE